MDIYVILAIVIVCIFLTPILYLLYLIGRCFYSAMEEHYRKKIIKSDPILGEIEYDDGYWVSLSENTCSVSIEANESGPAEEQTQFYIFLRNNLDKYIASAKQYLNAILLI